MITTTFTIYLYLSLSIYIHLCIYIFFFFLFNSNKLFCVRGTIETIFKRRVIQKDQVHNALVYTVIYNILLLIYNPTLCI